MERVVVVLSGGLDSTTVLHLIKKERPEVKLIGLFFNYGQRAVDVERENAMFHCKQVGAQFLEIDLDLSLSNSSILQCNVLNSCATSVELPFRNHVFMAYAMHIASFYEATGIAVGFLDTDAKTAYADTNTAFLDWLCEQYNTIAPLEKMKKHEVLEHAIQLGVRLDKVISCNTPVDGKPCGTCGDCKTYEEAWKYYLETLGY